ncbi:MAG: serine/threonine protein kinase [Pirellulaceae bacterium]|nr:serine/threonine protein kinase [Pirellulaceae bacterium]
MPPVPLDSLTETTAPPAADDSEVSDDAIEQQLAEIVAAQLDKMQNGQSLDINALMKQHPHLTQHIQEVWPALLLADVAGHCAASDEEEATSSHYGLGGRSPLMLGSDQTPEAFPGQMGDYELEEQIGRGGMGVVFRARQISLGRLVAVKMIQRERLTSEHERQRFLAEAQATARLDHPGIVPVYEVGDFDGHPFFSMQLITGKTLSERLSDGPLPQREAARMLADVARAIDHAHQQGILHRDIKPSNIIIGADGRPLVMDFGLAKFLDAANSLTHSGSILGTPSYMSPEQAGGRGASSGPAADIYSLGTVLYHMLTGRPPFIASSPIEMALKIIEHDPPLPRLLDPTIDRDLEMIVIRCLQKPPDLRYPSAGALADDLESFTRDEPVSARGGTFSDIVGRWFRETHHASVLENWGLLWMWHSVVLLVACILTQTLAWSHVENRLWYAALWTIGLGAWAAVFWMMRRQVGPVTFVERQIAHVWGASLVAIGMLWPLEWWLGLDPLTLSPLLGVITGMVFMIKAGILTGAFYVQAACLFMASVAMAVFPDYAHLIFGVVAATCFLVPGLKYYRQRIALEA